MAIAVGKTWVKTQYVTSDTLISYRSLIHYFTSLCILVRYTTHAQGMQSHCFCYCTGSYAAILCPKTSTLSMCTALDSVPRPRSFRDAGFVLF